MVKGIKIEVKTRPQTIKTLWRILSATNPKTGCIIEETKCPNAIIELIIAKFIPNFVVIKGYKGTNSAAYKSILKCPKLKPNKALDSFFIIFIVVNV